MLIVSDARSLPLAAESVQVCITSPPYWRFRDYGFPGAIGYESTWDDHLDNLRRVAREVWRVLTPDGSFWLNYGDGYCGSYKGGSDTKPTFIEGLKRKDLMMLPARVAFALQADGWWLRSQTIWHKSNPTPEGHGLDRPTQAHESLFLFAKAERYFYDAEAVKTLAKNPRDNRVLRAKRSHKMNQHVGVNGIRPRKAKNRLEQADKVGSWQLSTGAHLRNVWKVPTMPYNRAHFAAFPPKLIERPILASSRPGDIVLDPFCGSGTVVMVARQLHRVGIGSDLGYQDLAKDRIRNTQRQFLYKYKGGDYGALGGSL